MVGRAQLSSNGQLQTEYSKGKGTLVAHMLPQALLLLERLLLLLAVQLLVQLRIRLPQITQARFHLRAQPLQCVLDYAVWHSWQGYKLPALCFTTRNMTSMLRKLHNQQKLSVPVSPAHGNV